MQHAAAHEGERRRIIEAAYSCLWEPHNAPVPMSDILRRAEVSTRAFYRHFESKDDLLLALLRQECDALAARVDRIATEASGSPIDQLAAWIGQLFELCVDPQQRIHLTVIDSDEVRAARGYREMRERARVDRERSLTEILRRGREDGSFPLTEPETDAEAISVFAARVLAAQLPDDVDALKKAEDRVLDFALRSVGAVASR